MILIGITDARIKLYINVELQVDFVTDFGALLNLNDKNHRLHPNRIALLPDAVLNPTVRLNKSQRDGVLDRWSQGVRADAPRWWPSQV